MLPYRSCRETWPASMNGTVAGPKPRVTSPLNSRSRASDARRGHHGMREVGGSRPGRNFGRRVGFKFRRLVLRLRGNVRLEATGETEVARLCPDLPNGVRAERRNQAVQKLCGPRSGEGKGGQLQEHEETPLKTRCASGRAQRACRPLWRTPPSLLSYHVRSRQVRDFLTCKCPHGTTNP